MNVINILNIDRLRMYDTVVILDTTYLCQFVLGFLQQGLFLCQLSLCRLQSLSLGLHHTVHSSVHVHSSHPQTERLRSRRDTANYLGIEVRLGAILTNLLQDTVADVILVKVHQLFDEVLITCWSRQKQLTL